MKFRRALLFLLATIMLFSCSCQMGDPPEDSEPQHMAYRLGEVAYVDNDIYLMFDSSYNGSQIYAVECGSEDFYAYTPCFNPVCNHWDRETCNIAISNLNVKGPDLFTAFLYNGEPAFVLFNDIDTSFSMPYSNYKINLFCEDFVAIQETDRSAALAAYREWLRSDSKPRRSELLVYKDHLYYAELRSGVWSQYRVPLTGGEPERVFEEDNIIIQTIINDRFYGIRYENVDPEDPWSAGFDRNNMNYFRSDMNYENIEPLPETLTLFCLQGGHGFDYYRRTILDADADHIYFTSGMKVWAIPDDDIYAEPILISDMNDKIPPRASLSSSYTLYRDGVIYVVSNTEQNDKLNVFDYQGYPYKRLLWYDNTKLYAFDIRTGECRVWDITDQDHLMTEVYYANDEYVYGKCTYLHDDGRFTGATMRLTLDTMKYEVLLPDEFWEYSPQS